jgi:hypothetical protein
MGPTVCELEGPIPILNISNTLIMVFSIKLTKNANYWRLFNVLYGTSAFLIKTINSLNKTPEYIKKALTAGSKIAAALSQSQALFIWFSIRHVIF